MITVRPGRYCETPYLTSFGVETMREKLDRRHGERYSEYRRAWDRAERLQPPEFPLNIELDLIDACTLRCRQCLRDTDLAPEYGGKIGTGARLSIETIETVLEECRAHRLPSVNIGGSGECMLHSDFVDICAAVMRAGIVELRVISNGTLLTPAVADALIDRQVHFLSVSIDAHSPEVYGRIRGRSELYRQVVENVMDFLARRNRCKSEFPMLRVTFVRQKSNVRETDAFVGYWRRHADLIDIQTYADYRRTEYSTDFSCSDPWKRLSIWADGHIGPCCGFPGIRFDLGRAGRDSLHAVWHGKEINALRDRLERRDYPVACLKCQGTRETIDS